MSENPHTEAQALSLRAASLLRAGDVGEARALFGQAAELEQHALAQVPPGRPRTWGALAVSVAALFYKARRHEDAEYALHAFLANRNVLPDAREQLLGLLSAVRDELSLPDGFEYAGRGFELTLRGGDVGQGTAPLDLVLEKSVHVRNFLGRSLEMRAGMKFRREGSFPDEITEAIQIRASQARPGSFRFTIQIAAPAQLAMFPGLAAPALDGLTDFLLGFVATASSEGPHRATDLAKMVPDKDYRVAMLKLVRNVAPHGRSLDEVQLTAVRKDEGGVARSDVVLFRETRSALQDVIKQEAPPPEQKKEEAIRGVLRGLHLDERWLVIHRPGQADVRCRVTGDVFDDTIGPFVNKRVVAHGTYRRGHFEVRDIDLADD